MKIYNEVKLAKELMEFPSVTPVEAGVMKYLERKLKKLGFKTKIIEFKEKNFKPVKNLYAKFGKESPNFCFAGHLIYFNALLSAPIFQPSLNCITNNSSFKQSYATKK